MDYDLFEEALVDFFSRQHHDVEVARSRAAAIIHIAKGCDEQIVGGDRGMEIVLHCSEMIPIVPLVEFEEGRIACETIEEYLRERRAK